MKRANDERLRWIGAAAVAVLLAVAAGCGGGGGGGGSDDVVARGHAEFKRTCATCHGPDAEGMPRLGKNLHGNEFVASKSDAELIEFIKIGRPASHPLNERGVDMPPKGGNPALTEEQIELIVAYMRSIE